VSWREEYRKGSFRGVPFRTQFHERSGGRRSAIHEFPGRDEPVVEDLGRRALIFTIECHVIGTDYRDARDRLIEALEDAGTGLLVHPWHGRMMVSVLDYTQSENTDDGGLAHFSITFAEAGQPVNAPAVADSGDRTAHLASTVLAEAPGRFAARFTIAGAASYVEDSASKLVREIAAVTATAGALKGGVGPALRTFEAGLEFLPDNLSGLLRAPLHLGQAVTGLVAAVSALSSREARAARLAPLELMLDWEPPAVTTPFDTPQRRLENTNRTALVQLFREATAAELARETAELGYASATAAATARDGATGRLDARAIEAADRGDDGDAAVFDRLRVALSSDIALRAERLARSYTERLEATEPALVVAWRHEPGTSAIEQRALELTRRNRLPHPGFLPGGREVELLAGERSAA